MDKEMCLDETLEGRVFETEEQELKAVEQAPWLAEIRTFTRKAVSGGKFFTHSNRLVDARVGHTLTAGYAKNGDTTAELAGAERMSDLCGSAGDSPKFKLLMAPYGLAGEETSLAEAVISGRLAGKLLAGEEQLPSCKGTHTLDKLVLMPSGDEREYLALLPKTPAYLYPALLAAAKHVGFSHIQPEVDALAGKGKLKASDIPSFLGIRVRARTTQLSKAQNFSFLLNKIGGRIAQPLFLPPAGGIPSHRKTVFLSRVWANSGRLPIGLLTGELRAAIADSGILGTIAHQRHRHGLAPGEPIDNAATREAYKMLGCVVGNQLRETLGLLDLSAWPNVSQERDAMLKARYSDDPGWLHDVENRLFDLIPVNYRLAGGRERFRKGFFSQGEVSPASDKGAHPAVQREVKHEGRYLMLRLRATDVDVGSNGISIGLPSLTAIHGLLHSVVERQADLNVKRFYPVFSRVVLNDTLARRATSHLAVWRKGIKAALKGDEPITAASMSLGMGASSMNGRSAVNGEVKGSDKPVSQPFNNDVKATVEMSLVVELRGNVDTQSGTALVERITQGTLAARLAGGPITTCHCSFRNEIPRLKGFALERVMLAPDQNPFEALFNSVAFRGRDYLGEFPIGAVHTGYEALAPAGRVRRYGQEWDALHVESLYTLFRFVRATNENRQWFRLKVRNPEHPTMTLI